MEKNSKVSKECEDCLIVLKDLHASWDKIIEMRNLPDEKSWSDVIVIGFDEEDK